MDKTAEHERTKIHLNTIEVAIGKLKYDIEGLMKKLEG